VRAPGPQGSGGKEKKGRAEDGQELARAWARLRCTLLPAHPLSNRSARQVLRDLHFKGEKAVAPRNYWLKTDREDAGWQFKLVSLQSMRWGGDQPPTSPPPGRPGAPIPSLTRLWLPESA